MSSHLPSFVRVWFGVDLVVALFPPLYWWAGESTALWGMPRVIVYLFGASAFIAVSVVAAYLGDGGRGRF